MAVLDQQPGQLIACPGVRHFHAVKLLILVMVVNEQGRNIPLPDFLVKTQVRIWKCGTGALYDEASHIPI